MHTWLVQRLLRLNAPDMQRVTMQLHVLHIKSLQFVLPDIGLGSAPNQSASFNHWQAPDFTRTGLPRSGDLPRTDWS